MINVGGNSYNNGIRFRSDKYNVSFETIDGETKIYLRSNSGITDTKKESKFTDFITKRKHFYTILTALYNFFTKTPFIRGITAMMRNSPSIIYIVLINASLETALSRMDIERQIEMSSAILFVILINTIFAILSYVYIIKKIFKNIKSTWEYHGAEHKVIFTNYENKELTLENCRKSPRISDNCGSMLVFLILFSYVFILTVFLLLKVQYMVSLSFIIAYSISYEMFLMDRNNKFLKPIFKLGYWFQEHVVTREPDDFKLSQAIDAFKILEKAEKGEIPDNELEELLKAGNSLSLLQKMA
ncbi:MAG: DUF1385 domain-containing protein [Clostridia bacterium]|nr:DUF1385 domain-containing protein [Clostridia bacterium]